MLVKTVKTEKIPILLWVEEIEPECLQQAKNLANLPSAYHHIALMPDAHVGYGMPIGGILATKNTIIPYAVGVDIGCGMCAVQTSLSTITKEQIEQIIGLLRGVIPTGFKHHKKNQPWEGFSRAPNIEIIQQELESARRQLGTLGSGNHFVDILQGSDGFIWLMLHSGSRNFGYKTATTYHRKAKEKHGYESKTLPDKDLAFFHFDTTDGQEYYQAMSFCLEFAQANRALMMKCCKDVVHDVTGASFQQEINIHHNYAAVEKHFGETVVVHRKGATLAQQGQQGIIPGSMGTPSYIVEGLGNNLSFNSCSHGAGRLMGRKEANRRLSRIDCEERMQGIVHSFRHGLDEAPQVYKNIEAIMKLQDDLVKPLVKLFPKGVLIED